MDMPESAVSFFTRNGTRAIGWPARSTPCADMATLHDIVEASPLEDYKVAVVFGNGERGVFDCSRHLNRPYWRPLNDNAFFRQVRVDCGTLVWPDDIDVGQEDVWEFSVKEVA